MTMDKYMSDYVTGQFSSSTPSSATIPEKMALHAVDYTIFVLVLIISLGIGFYYAFHGEGQNSTSEYLMGRRRMTLIPVSISMIMSYVSAIFILGNAAEMFKHGAQYSLVVFGSIMAVMASSYLFVPMLYRLKLVSSFQYLELRYKRPYVKKMGTIMSITTSVFYIGLASFAPSTALEAVTDVPAWISIILLGVVVTVYTTLGGMRAVVWTDVFQGVIYVSGIIFVLVMGTYKVGGMGEVFRINNENGRLNFFHEESFNPDPTIRLTFWSMIVGRTVTSFFMIMHQSTVQRFCSLRTQREAYISVFLMMPSFAILYVLTCLVGLVVFAYFAKIGCDPLRAGYIQNSNQVLPFFVIKVLNFPGVPGLFLSVMYSGALSSISSVLSCLSAITWKDFLEERYNHFPEVKKAFVTKVLVFIYGIVGVTMAFIVKNLTGHVMMLTQSFLSSVGGPLYSMFILGGLFPCANALGAVIGAASGLVLGLWMAIGGNIEYYHRSFPSSIIANCTLPANTTIAPIPTNPSDVFPMHRISFMMCAVFAIFLSIIVGLVVSLATGSNKSDPPSSDVLIPVADKFCCCIPDKYRQKCNCESQFDKESVNSFQTNGMKEMHVINEVVYTNLSTSPKYAADQQEPLFSD